jgi:hypothetical protein
LGFSSIFVSSSTVLLFDFSSTILLSVDIFNSSQNIILNNFFNEEKILEKKSINERKI